MKQKYFFSGIPLLSLWSMDVGNLISGSSAFSKSSLYIWKSWFTYCWSLACRILSNTLLACEMHAIVRQSEHSLALSFFGTGIKTDLFPSYGHCWVFQICWHIECWSLTASTFRIWNSSGGIPSPSLALFTVMLIVNWNMIVWSCLSFFSISRCHFILMGTFYSFCPPTKREGWEKLGELLRWLFSKEYACQCRRHRRCGLDP